MNKKTSESKVQSKKKRKSNLFLGEVFFGTEDREKLFTEAVAPYYTPVKKEKNKKNKEA
ncbi:hypothetical protein [Bacillus pumilus]|uniref:hypothetical protein n=1 Tax=Bacillus pumilus TaxID=1408 RepID=UPI00017A6446|nr:hypothetical protein [Bacillus pumilus]MDR4995782.1 hypothetical protein [Bacillus altitudinis]EDW20749.1 hypothetical protein BAT_1579 [Bacillus pumilus ATCC 7061]MCR4353405.1 hypothetical protein [Bacillus pumilus]MCY7505159.1 hypothetical protein [Bacillus pumilus]MED4725697.1 hypothetical protein [Bacillus pumilus]